MSNVSPIFFDVGSLEEEDRRLVTLGAMHPFRIAMDPLTTIIEEDIQVLPQYAPTTFAVLIAHFLLFFFRS